MLRWRSSYADEIAANDPTLPPSVQDDVSLLVTELVTNAVRHGGAANDRPLHNFEPPAPPTSGDESGGWGLFLVDQVAERWGVCPAPAGTCFWFEMPAGVTA